MKRRETSNRGDEAKGRLFKVQSAALDAADQFTVKHRLQHEDMHQVVAKCGNDPSQGVKQEWMKTVALN